MDFRLRTGKKFFFKRRATKLIIEAFSKKVTGNSMSYLGWIIVFFLVPLMAVFTAGHALLHKRDPRVAFGWVAVCFFFPVAGPILYFLFGVNRVSTRAKKLKHRSPFYFYINYPRTDDTKRGSGSPTQLLSQLADVT